MQPVVRIASGCRGEYRVNTGWIQGEYRVNTGWIQGKYRVNTGWIQGKYRVNTGWIQGKYRVNTGWIQGAKDSVNSRSNVVASYIHHYRAFPIVMVLRYVDIVAISQHRRHSRNKELPLYCTKNWSGVADLGIQPTVFQDARLVLTGCASFSL